MNLAVPNNLPVHNELKGILDSYNFAWRDELAEAARAAQAAIRTVDIADITVSAKELANAMSKIKPIDYNAELRESAKALASILAESKPLTEQLQENLRAFAPALKQIEIDTAETTKLLAANLQLFARTLEDAYSHEAAFDEEPDEEDCIDEETADYLAAVVSQVQTAFEPKQAVPFERLRNWIRALSFEACIALLTLLATIIFGIMDRLPDPQITEQNQILTGIWQEMQEYNDNLTPAPTPECTPTPTEQWLST